MLKAPKVTVAQINDVFYHKSETFIHHAVSYLKNFRPIFLAHEFKNLDLFPLKSEEIFKMPVTPPLRYSREWFYYGILRKILKIDHGPEEILFRREKVRLVHAHVNPFVQAVLHSRASSLRDLLLSR